MYHIEINTKMPIVITVFIAENIFNKIYLKVLSISYLRNKMEVVGYFLYKETRK